MPNHDLKTRAYETLRKKLIHCHYPPGTMLNEAQLSEELGVSRTPIREALNRIAHEGYVRILPKKGILVTDVSLNDVMQIFQARLTIEPVVIRLAGPSLPKEELLSYRAKFMGKEPDPAQGFTLDTDMHLFIVDHCGNRFLVDMMHKVFDENTRVVISTRQNETKIHDARQEHLEILNLLLNEKYAEAEESMAAHVETCRRAALDFFYNLPSHQNSLSSTDSRVPEPAGRGGPKRKRVSV